MASVATGYFGILLLLLLALAYPVTFFSTVVTSTPIVLVTLDVADSL